LNEQVVWTIFVFDESDRMNHHSSTKACPFIRGVWCERSTGWPGRSGWRC